MHILSAEQFKPPELELLFDQADYFRGQVEDEVSKQDLRTWHAGKILCSLFYEQSTRTRLSFEVGAYNFGMNVIGTENARAFSSAAKGESLEDTIRVLNEYGVDIIALRYDEEGGAERAAAVSKVPIINGGDGKGEHPTQAMLDAYTIRKSIGRLDNLNIVMGGDLKNGRTVRSLAKVASMYEGNRITFVSIPELQIRDDIKTFLTEKDTQFAETSEMLDAFKDADVVYWTRLQKERQDGETKIEDAGFVIDHHAMTVLPESAIVMHPLPNSGEIDPLVYDDPKVIPFEQAGNGLYIRMGLIDMNLTCQ